MSNTAYLICEIMGTIAFSVSGALVGIKKKMDIFGVAMLGLITAVGGGVFRDLIIGVNPPKAFQNPLYALIAIVVAIITFLPAVRQLINLDQKLWVFIDAIGLAVFTVIGVKAGQQFNNIFLEVFLGIVTGVGGGVVRDICAQEMPMVFVRHFYACASLVGALICALFYSINSGMAVIIGIIVIIVLRMLAAKYKWHLPKA